MRAKMTEEERKESRKVATAKYRDKNRDNINKTRMNKYYNNTTHYVVYKHTNSKGDVYIGCGTNLRPYEFSTNNRSKEWFNAFHNNDCKIHIISEFKDKKDAKEFEKSLITDIGLDNLINQKH